MSASERLGEGIIRPALAGDYERIVEVWSACGLGIERDGRESEAAFRAQLERFPGLLLVACADDELVGVVLGTHDGRKGWISRLAVSPAFRRRGIASELVSACESAIRALGIEIVCALVEPHNDASAEVFRKLGFSDQLKVRYFRKKSAKN